PTTTCRTSSRKSALSFTSKRQRRPVRVQDRNPGRKRSQAAARKRAQASATAATLSMRSSKSWTRTRKSERDVLHISLTKICRTEEHTSELQSPYDLVCRLLLE